MKSYQDMTRAELQTQCDSLTKTYSRLRAKGPKPWCKYDKVKFLCPVPGDGDFLCRRQAGCRGEAA